MIRRSLAGRLLAWILPLLAFAIALPLLLLRLVDDAWFAGLLSALVVLPLAAWVLHRMIAPVRALFRALSGTVLSYRDGEYSFGVHWEGSEELRELVRSHAELGEVVREQRQGLVQRELLLDTMVQNTPVAMLLVGGDEAQRRVLFANLAARHLLGEGRRLESLLLEDVLAQAPPELREAVARGNDSLFTIGTVGDEETGEEQAYHLACRNFRLNGRRHELILLRRLTNELRREEVKTWKKVIRVISHELNNSLAPVASLARSGSELVRRGQHGRLEDVFATIEERARHLEDFISGYARFAKLPQPQPQAIDWREFLASLQQQLRFAPELPDGPLPARIDPAQMQQALLNLLKNAHESGSPAEGVGLRLTRLPGWTRIEVQDRGPGMSEVVLQNALVPFYSTKRHGTGLGLALAREIIEAHGGRISLHNREGGGLTVALQLPEATSPA